MGANVVLCGPPTMLPAPDFSAGLPWSFERTYRIDEALDGADVIMLLRMQLERQTGGLFPSLREYVRTYALTEERLAHAKPGAVVMHPGPMNEGVEIDPRVARSAQSVIETQVTNGVAVRMALLYLLSGLPA
jgi:aspartate carbamoyltransferase catalytic subunit